MENTITFPLSESEARMIVIHRAKEEGWDGGVVKDAPSIQDNPAQGRMASQRVGTSKKSGTAKNGGVNWIDGLHTCLEKAQRFLSTGEMLDMLKSTHPVINEKRAQCQAALSACIKREVEAGRIVDLKLGERSHFYGRNGWVNIDSGYPLPQYREGGKIEQALEQ